MSAQRKPGDGNGQGVLDAQTGPAIPLSGASSVGEGDQPTGDTQTRVVSSPTETNPDDARGQSRVDTHAHNAPASSGPSSASDGGHSDSDTHAWVVSSLAETASAKGAGQAFSVTQDAAAPPLAETIAAIRAHHRERFFWMEQRKRADLALGAYLRSALGWTLDKPAAEREAIRAQAAEIMAIGESHVKATRKLIAKAQKTGVLSALPAVPETLRPWAHIVVPQIEMRGKTDELEAVATKAMVGNAKKLPVHEWAAGIRGFGSLGLAIIVAEAAAQREDGSLATLSDYKNPGKLWTRMGLGCVYDDKAGKWIRQGGLSKTASKEDWIKHQYNRRRRSKVYTIGVSLVMAGDTPYRQLYLDRKAYERARAEAEGLIVVPASKVPKGKQAEYRTLGHIDNRSRRYVEKRLLRDLWGAWRSAREFAPEGQSTTAGLHAS